jgi:hypothetical protein
MEIKVTAGHGKEPEIRDGSGYAPAIIEYAAWINSQLSIARYYGGVRINGRKYVLMDSGEPAEPGKFIPDLVREDWCSLYKEYKRSLKLYIREGMTPAQTRKALKRRKANEPEKNHC